MAWQRRILRLLILFVICSTFLIATIIVATHEERVTQVNEITGATRTKITRHFVFGEDWNGKDNWATESARRLGIDTSGAWRHLTTVRSSFFVERRGCSRLSPATKRIYLIPNIAVDQVPENVRDEIIRRIARADETGREEIILELMRWSDPLRDP